MAPVQVIPTVNQNGMNMAVSSFVQASQTQKTAQTLSTAKEIEHESLQDIANMQVLKEAGQVDTLTSSAVIKPYDEDEHPKEQAFFGNEDDEEEDAEESENEEEFDENSDEQQYAMQEEEFKNYEQDGLEEVSSEPLLGNVLNIKV